MGHDFYTCSGPQWIGHVSDRRKVRQNVPTFESNGIEIH